MWFVRVDPAASRATSGVNCRPLAFVYTWITRYRSMWFYLYPAVSHASGVNSVSTVSNSGTPKYRCGLFGLIRRCLMSNIWCELSTLGNLFTRGTLRYRYGLSDLTQRRFMGNVVWTVGPWQFFTRGTPGIDVVYLT